MVQHPLLHEHSHVSRGSHAEYPFHEAQRSFKSSRRLLFAHPMNSPATAELMHPILFPPTASIHAEDFKFLDASAAGATSSDKGARLARGPNSAALKLELIIGDV